jgi:leucyl-tRNA synthetase
LILILFRCLTTLTSDVVLRFIETQLLLFSPICPHVCEHLWVKLGKPGLIVNAQWPVAEPVDLLLGRQAEYVAKMADRVRSEFLSAEEKQVRRREFAVKKGLPFDEAPISTCTISVAAAYPDWQQLTIELAAQNWDEV